MEKRNSNLNIPNTLSAIRVLLVPVVIWLIAKDRMIPALIVFLAACLTDILDGYIARTYDMKTRLGNYLDPFADKLMAVSVLLTFAIRGIIPFFVVIVLAVKELMMLIAGVLLIKNGHTVPSNTFGKIAAFMLNASIASGFLYQYIAPYYLYAIYVSLVFVVAALVQYAAKHVKKCFVKTEDMDL